MTGLVTYLVIGYTVIDQYLVQSPAIGGSFNTVSNRVTDVHDLTQGVGGFCFGLSVDSHAACGKHRYKQFLRKMRLHKRVVGGVFVENVIALLIILLFPLVYTSRLAYKLSFFR